MEYLFQKFFTRVKALYTKFEKSEVAEQLALKARLAELNKDKKQLINQFDSFSQSNEATFRDFRNSLEESITDLRKKFTK